MTVKNFREYDSQEYLPNGESQIMVGPGAATESDTINNTIPSKYLTMGPGAAGAQILISTVADGSLWRVSANVIWRCLDAIWIVIEWGVRSTTPDADGYQYGGQQHALHSACSWMGCAVSTVFRLPSTGAVFTAGIYYNWSSGYNQRYYQSNTFLTLCGYKFGTNRQ